MISGHNPNTHITYSYRNSGLTWCLTNIETDMGTLFVSQKWVICLQSTKIKHNSCVTNICHESPWPFNPDVEFFVIYVTVLCKPYCPLNGPKSFIHIRLFVPVDFVRNTFSFHYFLILAEFISHRKSVTLPRHLRYQNDTVKIQRDLKDQFW